MAACTVCVLGQMRDGMKVQVEVDPRLAIRCLISQKAATVQHRTDG